MTQTPAVNSTRDARRREKARAILARADPDWRAVKRARRLLHDAEREVRIGATERWREMLADLGKGFIHLGEVFRSAMAPTMPRIPILPPGDEIVIARPRDATFRHEVVVKPSRYRKTMALARAAARAEAMGVKVFDVERFASSPSTTFTNVEINEFPQGDVPPTFYERFQLEWERRLAAAILGRSVEVEDEEEGVRRTVSRSAWSNAMPDQDRDA